MSILGGSLLKRKRVSSPITSLNSELVGSTVARRTRSRRLSSSPVVDANEPTVMDNPEVFSFGFSIFPHFLHIGRVDKYSSPFLLFVGYFEKE